MSLPEWAAMSDERLSPLEAYDLLAAHAAPAARGRLLSAALGEMLGRRFSAEAVSDLYAPEDASPPRLAKVIELPRFVRVAARAASARTGHDPAVARHEVVPGIACTQRDLGERQVEIIVEADDSSWAGSWLHLSVTDTAAPESAVPYVVLLHDSPAGGAESSITVPASGAIDVALGTEPAGSVALDDGTVDVVERSVRACTTPADRNAWRAVARGRPADDPVRDSIVANLR